MIAAEFNTLSEMQANVRRLNAVLFPPKKRARTSVSEIKPVPLPEPEPLSVRESVAFERYIAATEEPEMQPKPQDTVVLFVADIIRAVSAHYGVSVHEIKSARRVRKITQARQIAMWFARRKTNRSLPEIGRMFGGRDHTTCLHAVRKIDALRLSDFPTHQDIEAITAALVK